MHYNAVCKNLCIHACIYVQKASGKSLMHASPKNDMIACLYSKCSYELSLMVELAIAAIMVNYSLVNLVQLSRQSK